MFESTFSSLRKTLDSLEKTVEVYLSTTKIKPKAYSVAASYTVDKVRLLSSRVIIESTEDRARGKFLKMIETKYEGKPILFHSTFVDIISDKTIDTIKKDC